MENAGDGFARQRLCGVVKLDSKGDWHYQHCRLVEVHDGDTITVEIDLGFRLRLVEKFRLAGINAPEINTPEGKAARAYLVSIMAALPIEMWVYKAQEKFGRWLAWVSYPAGSGTFNQQMIDAGHAVSWDGQGPKPLPVLTPPPPTENPA